MKKHIQKSKTPHIDVDGFADQQVRLLNYVAVSRASSLLYVLYDYIAHIKLNLFLYGDI